MITLSELKDKLAQQLDEITLMEVLEINSRDLVERFSDEIEDKFEQLEGHVE